MIHYGSELDPDRFHATLNGQDVTACFHPGPRESESMRQLPFVPGSNRLEFDVWRLPRRDLPKGGVLDNEIHRLEIIVEEKPAIRPVTLSGAAAKEH